MSEPWPSLRPDNSEQPDSDEAPYSPSPSGPKWTWPSPSLRPFPLACRFVPTDQWFRTTVDPSWSVLQTKQHLLSQCLPSPPPSQTAPGRERRSIKLSLRPFRKDRERLKMTHLRVPSAPVDLPPSPTSATALLQPQATPAPRTPWSWTSIWEEEGYMLFSFCNGNLIPDSLPLSATHLRAHDLVELQSPYSYTALDRSLRYIEPFYRGTLDLFSEYEDEIDTVTQCLEVLVREGMVVLTGRARGGKEPVLSLSLSALYILEEVAVPFPLDKPPRPASYIRAIFRVPSAQDKVWSSSHFQGRTYNFLCPDEASHEHLLRVLALYWRGNTRSSTGLAHSAWRLRTYRRALLRDAVYLRPLRPTHRSHSRSEQPGEEGTEPDLDLELEDPGEESEREWEGWREVWDAQGLLRSSRSAGVLREGGGSLERTRTR